MEVWIVITRRRFLTISGGMLASALFSACLSQENAQPEVDEIVIQPGDVPQVGGAPVRNQPGRFYLINNQDGLLAMFTRCTHQGCNVEWENDDDEFHCPCHGSRFNRHGEETAGPAPRPLDLMTVEVMDGGSIKITTGPIVERDEWEPGQSVPHTT